MKQVASYEEHVKHMIEDGESDPGFIACEHGYLHGQTGISDEEARSKCPFDRYHELHNDWWMGFSDGLPEGDARIGTQQTH